MCYFSTGLAIVRFLGQTQHQNCNLFILPKDAQVFASFLLRPKDRFYCSHRWPLNGCRSLGQAAGNEGKLKTALGSFHTRQRIITLKATVNCSTTEPGVNRKQCNFQLNLCLELKDTTTVFALLSVRSIYLARIIKTS